jgi:hypothetical protein
MSIFKTCPSCEAVWATRSDFLADREVLLVGYQSSYTVSQPGLFLFNHSCDSTIAVDASDFKDMYNEDICQSCEAHRKHHPAHCCKGMTGEDKPKKCVCKFSKAIECKLEGLMHKQPVNG